VYTIIEQVFDTPACAKNMLIFSSDMLYDIIKKISYIHLLFLVEAEMVY